MSLGSRLGRKAIFFLPLAATVVMTLSFVLAIKLAPNPAPYASIALDTEMVRYRVVNPVLAAVPVVGASTRSVVDCNGGQVGDTWSGLLRPAAGSIVQYRWSPDRVAIEIARPKEPVASLTLEAALKEPVASLTLVDETECNFQDPTAQVTISMPERGLAHPLPLAGPAESGSESSAATAGSATAYNQIRSGEVKVFGRTVFHGELYPVNSAIYPIPAGSRLASGPDFKSGQSERSGAAWYGRVRADQDGFDLSVTTDANHLLLYRWGLDDQTETFSFGLFTRIFNDPSLGLLALGFATFFLLTGAVTGWVALWKQ